MQIGHIDTAALPPVAKPLDDAIAVVTDLLPIGRDYMPHRVVERSWESGVHFQSHDLRRTYGRRLHLAGIPGEIIAWLMRRETFDRSFRSNISTGADD
jgi:hypothetical protein